MIIGIFKLHVTQKMYSPGLMVYVRAQATFLTRIAILLLKSQQKLLKNPYVVKKVV